VSRRKGIALNAKERRELENRWAQALGGSSPSPSVTHRATYGPARIVHGLARVARTWQAGSLPATAIRRRRTLTFTPLVLVATCSYISAMASVGIRNLKNHLSRYVRRVTAGERVAVTDRGRVVAELVPPSTSSATGRGSRLEELVAAGVIRPTRERGDPLANLPILRLPPGTATALIDQDRDEA